MKYMSDLEYRKLTGEIERLNRENAALQKVAEELQANSNMYITELGSRIDHLTAENKALRNELCLKCERYKQSHKGACDGCRWREKNERH